MATLQLKELSPPEIADAVASAKLRKDNASRYWSSMRDGLLRLRRKTFKSDRWMVRIIKSEGGMIYDPKKLDKYFRAQGINPRKFKSLIQESERVLITRTSE